MKSPHSFECNTTETHTNEHRKLGAREPRETRTKTKAKAKPKLKKDEQKVIARESRNNEINVIADSHSLPLLDVALRCSAFSINR